MGDEKLLLKGKFLKAFQEMQLAAGSWTQDVFGKKIMFVFEFKERNTDEPTVVEVPK